MQRSLLPGSPPPVSLWPSQTNYLQPHYIVHTGVSTEVNVPYYWTEMGSYVEGMISDSTDIARPVSSYVSSDAAPSVAANQIHKYYYIFIILLFIIM